MTHEFAFELAEQSATDLRERTGIEQIDLALVLGSGWKTGIAELGEELARIPLGEIVGFTKPAVEGHGGDAVFVRTLAGTLALVLTGRTHYYEGLGVAAVVHGVRTSAALGAKTIILTNGCGGLNEHWSPGTVVLIRDHINLTMQSPIVGAKFVDLSDAYSSRLRELAHDVDPTLPEGVYVQFCGPHYETPAEVRMAKIMGGDLVGMSTTLETIAARESGMEVLGLSLVTNPAAGISKTPLSHEEVLQAGEHAGPRISHLLAEIVGKIQ